MNINSNELLLLNKKIKFAGEAGKPAADVTVPAPDTNTPQTGMNALMFQGLNNVVSDPQLAGELKIMKETDTAKTEDKAAQNNYLPQYPLFFSKFLLKYYLNQYNEKLYHMYCRSYSHPHYKFQLSKN